MTIRVTKATYNKIIRRANEMCEEAMAIDESDNRMPDFIIAATAEHIQLQSEKMGVQFKNLGKLMEDWIE